MNQPWPHLLSELTIFAVGAASFFADWFYPPGVATFLTIWLAAVGGAIGSFLNVVIYRVPAGKSIVHPGSHCPRCGHAIRWHDNLPVAGWLLLRGKCRDCGLPISPRYPLVEALVAGIFVLLAWAEVFSGGASLPVRGQWVSLGPEALVLETPLYPPSIETLWSVYALHLLLVATILCLALIDYDGGKTPWRIAGPILLAAVAAPLAWPELRPIALCPPTARWAQACGAWAPQAASLLEGAMGAAFGLAAGGLVVLAGRGRSRIAGPSGTPMMVGLCVGLTLAWQAAVALAAVASLALLALSLGGRWGRGNFAQACRQANWTACLGVGLVCWLVAWRPLVERFPALGQPAGLGTLIAALAAATLAAGLCRVLMPGESV